MIIDQEFKSLNRKLNESEYKKLEASIIQEGIRDPLVLWNGILIDGHNRLDIATKHDISYSTINNNELADREEVKTWIINNQLGRRNLTPNEVSYYRGKLYESQKRQGNRTDLTSGNNYQKSTAEEIAERYGVSEKTIRNDAEFSKAVDRVEAEAGIDIKEAILSGRANVPKKNVEDVIKVKREAPEYVEPILNGDMTITQAKREIKRAKVIQDLESIETKQAKEIRGVYDVIVIDPPWQMEKIERDVAPNQVNFDYPTMTIEEITNLDIPCASDCHVWLWTTHKYLPTAFEILKAWSLKYVCTFVWHKPGGFQPFRLPQYNCEFALYARRGSPDFIDLKDFKLCFDAPRNGHSSKPDEFYDLIRRVTAGRRLDMFNRRSIDGFDRWGKEAA